MMEQIMKQETMDPMSRPSIIEPLKMNFWGDRSPFVNISVGITGGGIQGPGAYLGASLASMAASSPMAVWTMTS